MATVRFKNISKVYDDGTRAIDDFNLDISDGELLVLVGPSGCGKSTLLRMLAGLETASQGELLIDDQVVNAVSPQQRNIAMVFQNYALYPHMSVRRNLEFPLRMLKLGKQDMHSRVNEVAQLLGLSPLLERKPKQLSGGQRQRVAMGRAIVRQPQVFLMDEPLSNLDARLRLQIRSEIASLQRRLQTTMLYVTHDQVEAMTLGDRVAVLHQGRLQQVDEPQQLYTHPANIFVARFMGNPGMNIFRTLLVKTGAQPLALQWGEQNLPLSPNLPMTDSDSDALQPYIGMPVFAGLRPEAIHLPGTVETEVRVRVTVDSIEALGHEFLLYFNSDVDIVETDQDDSASRSTLVARLTQRPLASPGETIELALSMNHLYLFDSEGHALAGLPGPTSGLMGSESRL